MAYLIVEKGASKGSSLELPDDGRVVVGRSEKVDFQIQDRFVSRTHFAVAGDGNKQVIEDLDSDNGTFVNGEAVQKQVLQEGDHIQIGETYLSFVTEESKQKRGELVGETVGGYEILERIGRGGMGTVYRARQISLDREVALKILDSELVKDEKFVDQFFNEARSAAKLNHPNVTKVYDVGEAEDIYYLSMEYIRGGSLHDLLSEREVLGTDRATEITLDIAKALKYARRKDLVHRDIKPANIMLTEDGKAKLIDLGIAKQGLKEWEEEDVMVGTPDYMAPEQATDQSVDTRADIYALGVTFYRMVTGERPIKGETPDEVIDNKFEQDPIPPKEKNKNIPKWVSSLIMDMIHKRPSNRISSPEQVVDRIERGRKQSDKKRKHKRLLTRRVSSSRWPLFTAGAVVLLLLLGSIYILRYTGDTSNSNRAKKLQAVENQLEQLNQLRRNAYNEPSEETYTVAIQAHEQFLSEFENHKKSDEVATKLVRLKRERKQLLLDQNLRSLTESFDSITASFRQKTLDTAQTLDQVQKQVQSQVEDARSTLKNLEKEFGDMGSDQLSELKKRINSWEKNVTGRLSDFRSILEEVREFVDDDAFRRAFEILNNVRDGDQFQAEPFQSSLTAVRHTLKEKEYTIYQKRTNEVVEAIYEQNFQRARKMMSALRETMYTPDLRKKLSAELEKLSDRKQTHQRTLRQKRRKKEREDVLFEGVDLFVQMEQRTLTPEEASTSISGNLEFDRPLLYATFFEFMGRSYQKFYDILGNRISTLGIRIINDPKFGQARIVKSTTEWVELELPNQEVSATIKRSWNEYEVRTVLDLVYQNRNELKPDEKTSLAAMYYLFHHKQDVSGNRMKSLLKNTQAQLNVPASVTSDQIFTLLRKENESFVKHMIDTMTHRTRKFMADGELTRAWSYLQLLRSRYNENPHYQSREEEVQSLINHVKPVLQSNDGEDANRKLVTWPLFIEPYRTDFQKNVQSRVDRILLKMNYRMQYEKRGHILLSLGRYKKAFNSFVSSLPDNWLERLKLGKPARKDGSGTVSLYRNFFKSALLSEKPDLVKRNIRYRAVQLMKEQGDEKSDVNALKNWRQRLQKNRQNLNQKQRSFVAGQTSLRELQAMKRLFGNGGIPNLKKKYLIIHSIMDEFPDAKPVRSGDLLLASARILMQIGDFVGAMERFQNFNDEHPEHDRAGELKKDGGVISVCQKHISQYDLIKQ